MKRHFDSLVDIVKAEKYAPRPFLINNQAETLEPAIKKVKNISSYLHELLSDDFHLFHFPVSPIEILPESGLSGEQYNNYLDAYFQLCSKNDIFFKTPFDKTAIENPYLVTFLDPVSDNGKYVVTTFSDNTMNNGNFGSYYDESLLMMGLVDIKGVNKSGLSMQLIPFYFSMIDNNNLLSTNNSNLPVDSIQRDLINATMNFVQENVYIMDPNNFITRKMSNAALRSEQKRLKKSSAKKHNLLRKTIMRPHYMVMDENSTKEYLSDVAKKPVEFQPVRGYWKTLRSEKFTKMRNQTIEIGQYLRGIHSDDTIEQALVKGQGGWNYEVVLKDGLYVQAQKNPTELFKV